MSTEKNGSQDRHDHKSTMRTGIKAPLIFSAVLGVVGGVLTTIFATGGLNNPDKPLRVDLGLIFGGVFFITSLVVVAMMQLAAKDNPEHLSQGSGINRSSEEMHREAMAKLREKKRAEARAKQAEEEAAEQHGGTATVDEAPENPAESSESDSQ